MPMRRVLFFTAFSLLLFLEAAVAAEMVSIAGEDINMRSGPGTAYAPLWTIGSGFPVEIVSSKGEWLQVKDFEGSTGWLHKKTTQKTPYMIVKVNKGTDQQINVRSEPNAKAKIVAKANYGVVFKTLEKRDGWVKVEHGQGVTGWVESRLLWGF